VRHKFGTFGTAFVAVDLLLVTVAAVFSTPQVGMGFVLIILFVSIFIAAVIDEFADLSPEAPRQKSGSLRVFGLFTVLVLLILLAIVVPLYATVGGRATLAKAQADVQALASAVDQYQAHMGAPPATLAELLSPATNTRGQTAGPYRASIPPTARGFSDYRYERHADGHWTITTSGRDSCDRPHRIEARSGSSVTPTEFINCPEQFWWRVLFSAQQGPHKPVSLHAVGRVPIGRS